MNSHARLVSFRRIFGFLVALSVMLAPSVTRAAMASSDQDMQMEMAGHCQAPPLSSDDHGKMAGKSCCIAMCMAVAIAPASPSELRRPTKQVAQYAVPVVYVSSPREIATPPPRHT